MPDTTVKPAVAAAPPDDVGDLAQKQKELKTVSDELQDASTRIAALNAEIKALQTRIADVQKSTDAYSAGAGSQQQELDADQTLITQKSAMAAAAVKDQKDAIDKIVKSVDDDISGQSTKVDGFKTAADKANQDYIDAAAESKTKSDAYSALKQTQKNTDDQLKQIKALLDQASKSETQGDVVSMYFLLQEAYTAAKAVTVLSPADYAAKAKIAQADAEAAKTKAAEKKSDLDTQGKQYTDAQTQLAAAIASRRATILTKLKQIKPGPLPVPAPVPIPVPVPAPAPPAVTSPGSAR